MRLLRSIFSHAAAISMLAGGLAGWAAGQTPVTSPEKFFGFQLGADRKMARWDKIVEYYG